MTRSGDFLDQQHLLSLVDFFELDFDDLVVGGLHAAAHKARFDRKLAVAAVDQHQQLHARRASVVEQRIQGGANGAAGVQDVVHQDDVLAGDRERDFRGIHHGLAGNGGQVIAVQSDIQDADRDLAVLEGLDSVRQALRHGHAAAANADKGQAVQILCFLENFVRQPDQGAFDF